MLGQELDSKTPSAAASAAPESEQDAHGEWPELSTRPAPSQSGCNSDAVIELPLSLRVVPGPDAIAFGGFLDAAVLGLPEPDPSTEVVDADAEPRQTLSVRRYDTVLPPPPAADDVGEEEVILPSRER